MSILVNGSLQYGTFFDEWPSADIHAYTAMVAVRVVLPADTVGILWQVQTRGPVAHQFRYNTVEEPNIRTSGSGDDPKIPVAGSGALPTTAPGVRAWLTFRSLGALTPGVVWSGNLEWGYLVEAGAGNWTHYTVRSLPVLDVRLADEYWSEFLLGAFGVGDLDLDLENFRVWTRALSDAEIVAQARTFDSLYAGDEIHREPFLTVASIAAPNTNGADWSGTPLDGVSRPSYPDDAPEPEPTPTADWKKKPMAEILAPYDSETPNDFGGLKFTVSATSQQDVIPDELQGCRVQIVSSVDAEFGFSTHDDAAIDFAAAGTAEGLAAGVGGKLFAGVPVVCMVPNASVSLYFVRDAGGAGTIHMQKVSSAFRPPGV